MLYDISSGFNQTPFTNQAILDALDVISARPPTRTDDGPPTMR
jgi:hypothetical protein